MEEQKKPNSYVAKLKVTVVPGTVTLQLEFDLQTEQKLREEISHYPDYRAFIVFIITAMNLETSEQGVAVYKGCVAPVHCMPLWLNMAPNDKYHFQVHLCAYNSDFMGFVYFLTKQISYNAKEAKEESIEIKSIFDGVNYIGTPGASYSKSTCEPQKPPKEKNQELPQPRQQQQVVSGKTIESKKQRVMVSQNLQGNKQPYYQANVSIVASGTRYVTLVLTFNSKSVQQLIHEMAGRIGDSALLKFVVTVKNNKKRQVVSVLYTGAAVQIHYMHIPFPLKLGYTYVFDVDIQMYQTKTKKIKSISKTRTKHREVLSVEELWELLRRATLYSFSRSTEYLPVNHAYRNKPPPYFEAILQKFNGVMEVYSKDRNGDPGCPINEQIDGLFFGVRVNPTTRALPTESYFGSRRVILPIDKFVVEPTKLYFADFYCHHNVHHITLVLTKPQTKADRFCQSYLLELSLDDNSFFYRIPASSGSGYNYFCSREPRVEILYTEDIDLKQDYITWKTVTPLGMGSSNRNGIPKRSDCQICNLYPI